MQCSDFMKQVGQFKKDEDWHPAALQEMQEHLEQCSDCRLWWRVAQRMSKHPFAKYNIDDKHGPSAA